MEVVGVGVCGTDAEIISAEWDLANQRQLGNTPQAFSHVGLVNTALALDKDVRHATTG